jgi:hypothetical protein
MVVLCVWAAQVNGAAHLYIMAHFGQGTEEGEVYGRDCCARTVWSV